MAAKAKRRSRTAKPAEVKAPPVAAHPPRSRKNIVGIVVLAVFVLLAVEAVILLQKKPSGDFQVELVSKFNGVGKESGPFTTYDVASYGKERLAFTDQAAGAVQVFDLKGDFVRKIGGKGEGSLEFKEPSGLASDASGNLYVMDTWNSAIKGIDPNGDVFLTIDLEKFKNFYGPRGLAWDGSQLLIADTGSHRIVRMAPAGALSAAWGKRGSADGEFYNPTGVAVARNGDIIVADSDNQRIQILSSGGEPKKTIKVGFKLSDVAADSKGRFYVSSGEGAFVRAYSEKGKLLGELSDPNGSKDPFLRVLGLGVTPDNLLLCASNETIWVWKLP